MDKELLKKLKTLSEQGVGGEKDNAREMLDRLMDKYGVDESEIEEELQEHEFRYHGYWQKRVLLQVMSKFAPERTKYRYAAGSGSRSTIWCICTDLEAYWIQTSFEFYSKLWSEELQTIFRAYVLKHELYDPDPSHTDTVDSETKKRMRAMIAGMKDAKPYVPIEEVSSGTQKT